MSTLDATQILPNLYMGSRPPAGLAVRREGFDVLVLCASELQLWEGDFPGVEVQYIPLEDDSSQPVRLPEWTEIVRMGERVSRRIRNGKKVLVTCAMGLNRSGIVTASAIHFLTGASGCDAAARIQRKRVVGGHSALFNQAFVKALCARLPARRGGLPMGA